MTEISSEMIANLQNLTYNKTTIQIKCNLCGGFVEWVGIFEECRYVKLECHDCNKQFKITLDGNIEVTK